MNELQAIGGAMAGLKAASDLAKAIIDVKSAVDIQGKVFELQRVILCAQQDTFSAQQELSALLQERERLQAQIASMDAWNEEKQRYHLQTIGVQSSFAYVLKDEASNGEPTHQLCAVCFEQGRKSILQPHRIPEGRSEVLMCHACQNQILMSGHHDTRTVNARKPTPTATFGRQTRF